MIILEFMGLMLLITAAAYLLSEGAEILAEKFGANFAGSIVLGLVTTLPEYFFVIFACLKNEFSMAVGSAIGACSILTTLGYGMVILLATSRLSRHPVKMIVLSKNTQIDAFYLLATAMVALLLAWLGNGFDVKDGLILNTLFALYVFHLASSAAKVHRQNKEEQRTVAPARMRKAWIFLGVGAMIVFFASEPFVDSMIGLAHFFGVSPIVIAIILGPFASEMPEKMTAYITVLRNGSLAEISVCNFIGSAVNHNSLLLGIIPFMALLKGKHEIGPILSGPFLLMSGLAAFCALSLSRGKLHRMQGYVFVLLYGLLLWVSFRSFL